MPFSNGDTLQITRQFIVDTFFENIQPDPADILVCEIATLGFVAAKHPMLGIAFKRVVNGQAISDKVFVVDWYNEPQTTYCDPSRVDDRLGEQRVAYAQDGRPHGWPKSRITTDGHKAAAVANMIAEYLSTGAQLTQATTLVGHGLAGFSLPFYFAFLANYPPVQPFAKTLAAMPLFDTGSLYKALLNSNLIREGESFATYANRISSTRGGGKWNIFQVANDLGMRIPSGADMLSWGTDAAWEIFQRFTQEHKASGLR